MLIPYFGGFPEWFDLYLYSCSRNKIIDFHFFTDNECPENVYDNTIFHKLSFEEYVTKIESMLKVKYPKSTRGAYKLCDFKPFLGILHNDIANRYEWWGWGDVDVVYGDLSRLLNEENLGKFDLITTHIKCIAGHFTVIRTASKYTEASLSVPQWREALQAEESMWFDEVAYSDYVRPRKIRLIDKLWYRMAKRFVADRNKFYTNLSKILPGRDRMCYVEAYTTFKPIPSEKYIWDIKRNKFYLPGALDELSVVPGWYELPYLHMLYFKKVFYYDTEHYWREGFYHIPKGVEWESAGRVEITTKAIDLEPGS